MFDIYTSLIVINTALANKNDIEKKAGDANNEGREVILKAVLIAIKLSR